MPQIYSYMLAIMPPVDLMRMIDEKRKSFAVKYEFKAALKPPVHVTVYENFHATENIEKRFSALREMIKRQAPFSVELSNYGFFDNPAMANPVLYIGVKDNPALKSLQKTVLKEVNRIAKRHSKLSSYTPHFTIGYRDVSWDKFPQIKSEYSQQVFQGAFVCDTIFLWRHDHENWQIHDTFKFEGKEGDSEVYGQLDLF